MCGPKTVMSWEWLTILCRSSPSASDMQRPQATLSLSKRGATALSMVCAPTVPPNTSRTVDQRRAKPSALLPRRPSSRARSGFPPVNTSFLVSVLDSGNERHTRSTKLLKDGVCLLDVRVISTVMWVRGVESFATMVLKHTAT